MTTADRVLFTVVVLAVFVAAIVYTAICARASVADDAQPALAAAPPDEGRPSAAPANITADIPVDVPADITVDAVAGVARAA